MLTINNASKYHGNHLVLNKLHFTMNSDSIVGLAGPSGGGKSTLLRCLQGLESLDSGTIEYKGKKGFMFQDFQLFPHMTVLENLIYAPALHSKKTTHKTRAIALLDELGMIDKHNAFPKNLSGGQKQRVALARSLMMQPDLLLCDEPTSGLDMAAIDDVISLLNAIKNKGVSMIIASHDLSFLTKLCSRVVILKHGDFIADINLQKFQGSVEDLKQYYS